MLSPPMSQSMARSSSVLRLVSGISNVVKIPANMNAEKICMTWLSHGLGFEEVAPRVRRGAMAPCAMMEPIFPEPAEIP